MASDCALTQRLKIAMKRWLWIYERFLFPVDQHCLLHLHMVSWMCIYWGELYGVRLPLDCNSKCTLYLSLYHFKKKLPIKNWRLKCKLLYITKRYVCDTVSPKSIKWLEQPHSWVMWNLFLPHRAWEWGYCERYLWMKTSLVCPTRWQRSAAWTSRAGFQWMSSMNTWLAAVRLRPTPPACSASNITYDHVQCLNFTRGNGQATILAG